MPHSDLVFAGETKTFRSKEVQVNLQLKPGEAALVFSYGADPLNQYQGLRVVSHINSFRDYGNNAEKAKVAIRALYAQASQEFRGYGNFLTVKITATDPYDRMIKIIRDVLKEDVEELKLLAWQDCKKSVITDDFKKTLVNFFETMPVVQGENFALEMERGEIKLSTIKRSSDSEQKIFLNARLVDLDTPKTDASMLSRFSSLFSYFTARSEAPPNLESNTSCPQESPKN